MPITLVAEALFQDVAVVVLRADDPAARAPEATSLVKTVAVVVLLAAVVVPSPIMLKQQRLVYIKWQGPDFHTSSLSWFCYPGPGPTRIPNRSNHN